MVARRGGENGFLPDYDARGYGHRIVWVKDEELNAFLPLRATGGDDSITLLIPDEDEVKELVAAGKIQGSFDEKENAWLLSAEGVEELLIGKQFWNLGRSIPFLKKQKSGESEEPVPESEL
jgi:predicted RNA-binding protein with PUA domain